MFDNPQEEEEHTEETVGYTRKTCQNWYDGLSKDVDEAMKRGCSLATIYRKQKFIDKSLSTLSSEDRKNITEEQFKQLLQKLRSTAKEQYCKNQQKKYQNNPIYQRAISNKKGILHAIHAAVNEDKRPDYIESITQLYNDSRFNGKIKPTKDLNLLATSSLTVRSSQARQVLQHADKLSITTKHTISSLHKQLKNKGIKTTYIKLKKQPVPKFDEEKKKIRIIKDI